MSRIRSTLDSVTKAVGSSGSDLISKFSRRKPGAAVVDKAEAVTLNNTATETAMKEEVVEEEGVGGGIGVERNTTEEDTEKAFVAAKMSTTSSLASAAASLSAQSSSSSSTVAKQSMQLFHPAALSTNIDETCKTVAQHINSYFGTSTPVDEGSVRPQQRGKDTPLAVSGPILSTATGTTGVQIPILSPVAAGAKSIEAPTSSPTLSENLSPPASTIPATETDSQSVPVVPAAASPPKKGFTHYLSYPRPSVQAFVGSYIAPLVPKFRSDSKSIAAAAADKDKSPVVAAETPTVDKAAEKKSEEEERAKQQLLSQREKIIARVSVDNRTRGLVKGLQRVNDVKLLTSRVEELSRHLLEFPETRGVAIKERALPCLLRLRQARDIPLQASVREALALLGYNEAVKGRGIRILSIDGGGTRGLLALQALVKLQDMTGKPIHQLFDYICGVSTGAILAYMLGIFKIPLDECEEMYRKLGADVFKQNVIVGTVKMSWSHAFYDSEIWENILKERMGEGIMIESTRDPHCPKVSAVSTIVNRGLPLKAFVFRNYRLMPGVRSHYLGDCKYKMWEAIRASSAAPGYFQEFVLGRDLHQDGGLLINNPTALAIHECKCLWPNTPLQCVLSLGTGRYETLGNNSTNYTSLKAKITNVISSATDTEEVHTMLDALLPPDTYFRFNPYMTEDIPLNESRTDKLNFLKSEGERYLERNEPKLKKAASVLCQEKSTIQRLAEWGKLKSDMYDGLPFISKL